MFFHINFFIQPTQSEQIVCKATNKLAQEML